MFMWCVTFNSMEDVTTENINGDETINNDNPPQTPQNDNVPPDPKGSGQDDTPQITPPTQDGEDESEPPVRKSKLQYILERKERKLAKLTESQNIPPAQNEGEDDITPEEEARIERIMKKKFGAQFETVDQLVQKTEHDEVNAEITDFLQKDEYKDLIGEDEAKIRKYALHPSRAQIPLEEIVYGIAGKKLIAYGAEQARKAMLEAKKSRNSGSSARNAEGSPKKDWLNMTPEAFKQAQQEALQ